MKKPKPEPPECVACGADPWTHEHFGRWQRNDPEGLPLAIIENGRVFWCGSTVGCYEDKDLPRVRAARKVKGE